MSEQRTTRYVRWRRKAGLGHKQIWVTCGPSGGPHNEGPGVQCATLDRIPFMMKVRDLEARYEEDKP